MMVINLLQVHYVLLRKRSGYIIGDHINCKKVLQNKMMPNFIGKEEVMLRNSAQQHYMKSCLVYDQLRSRKLMQTLTRVKEGVGFGEPAGIIK